MHFKPKLNFIMQQKLQNKRMQITVSLSGEIQNPPECILV